MGRWEDRKLKAESSRERFTAEDNWEAERVGSWEAVRLKVEDPPFSEGLKGQRCKNSDFGMRNDE
jgi:hypothetical protein